MATNLLFGYSCCLIAGIGFAVNYLPVKSCDIGDGIFFSAAMSVGILLVGLVTGMFLTSTPNEERFFFGCRDLVESAVPTFAAKAFLLGFAGARNRAKPQA